MADHYVKPIKQLILINSMVESIKNPQMHIPLIQIVNLASSTNFYIQ